MIFTTLYTIYCDFCLLKLVFYYVVFNMNEIQKKNKELCGRMPYLIPRNVFTDKIPNDYDYSYIHADYELPKGWLKLFLQMCEDIRQPLIDADYLDKFRFSQIKEKYGGMRCYTFGMPSESYDIVHDIISNYEYVSQFVCQNCGKPAKYETQGWIAGYCENCVNDNNIDMDGCELIEFNPVRRAVIFGNGESRTEEYDVSDIWNRLYE